MSSILDNADPMINAIGFASRNYPTDNGDEPVGIINEEKPSFSVWTWKKTTRTATVRRQLVF